jgi:hypothetical protein
MNVGRFFAVLLILMAAGAARARAADRIDPAYLAMKDCPGQPGCAAIVLLDDQEFNHESNRSRYRVHRMIKVFTDEGVQRHSDVTAPSVIGGFDVRNLQGRTILPDGSEIKLSQDNVFVKTLRKGKRWERTKSAKFPGVQPGSIIEYSFDVLTEPNSYLTQLDWYVQSRLPVVEGRFTSSRTGSTSFM